MPMLKKFLLAVVILFSLLFPSTVRPVLGQPAPTAVLTPKQGLVQRRADSDPDYMWQTVTQDSLISESDWVQTDNLGLAQITFFDGNLVEILPNSMIQVKEYKFADSDSPVLTIDQSVGDVRHQITRLLDAESRYEVDTPSAVVTVRGTNFFSSVTWQGESILNLETGALQISGVSPEGIVGPPLILAENQSLAITPDGQPGTPGPYNPPQYPPPAPLAPPTCGNAICEPGEAAVCALDCRTSASCGNGICEPEALEGPVTCRVDCVPAMHLVQTAPAAAQPTGQPCTISTTRGDVVVRVGPGFERGARIYLVTNTNVPVTGKYTDSAGNLWWKIQPPGFLPAEADRYWVLAADVTEAGDCAQVPEAPPSPVIAPQPPPPGPPPAVPTSPPGRVTPVPVVPTETPVVISFYADTYAVNPRKKECATIYWDVQGIREVYYQGRGVTGQGSSVECPVQTTTYTLSVVLMDGSSTARYVTITIDYTR
jgi:hypothetical protein